MRLLRERVARFVVRVVAAPHDLSSPISCERPSLGLGKLAPIQQLREVLARLSGSDTRVEAELADAAVTLICRCRPSSWLEGLPDPRAALLGHHELEAGEAFEDARHDQEPQRPVAKNAISMHEHQRRDGNLPKFGRPVPPEWRSPACRVSWHAAQIGSYSGA